MSIIILPGALWTEKHRTGHLTLSAVGGKVPQPRKFQKAKSRKMIRKSI